MVGEQKREGMAMEDGNGTAYFIILRLVSIFITKIYYIF